MLDDQFDIVDELEADYVRKRPDFITVLCILTWVGCGITMIINYYQLSLFGGLSRAFSSPEIRWYKWSAIVSIIMPLFCVGGSILMWNLRKIGFYIYLFGQAVPFLMSIYVTMIVMKMSGGAMASLVLWNIVPIAFTVMYATNLRFMRK